MNANQSGRQHELVAYNLILVKKWRRSLTYISPEFLVSNLFQAHSYQFVCEASRGVPLSPLSPRSPFCPVEPWIPGSPSAPFFPPVTKETSVWLAVQSPHRAQVNKDGCHSQSPPSIVRSRWHGNVYKVWCLSLSL